MSALPDSIYQPDPPKSFHHVDPVVFVIGILISVVGGSVGSTFDFALQMGFSEKLFGAASPAPDVASMLFYFSIFFVLLGLAGGPTLAVAGKRQHWNLALGGGFLLAVVGTAAYIYSRPVIYPPFAIGVWAYQFYDVPFMAAALKRSSVAFGVGFGTTLLPLFLLFGMRSPWVTSKAHGSARWSKGEHFKLGPLLSDSLAQRHALQPLNKKLRGVLEKLPGGVQENLRRFLPPSTARESSPVPGIPMGRLRGRLCYDASGVHQYVSAPTRSGKSVSFAVPTLLSYPGSMFIFDMKRELWHVTARRRAELNDGRVYRFDPFGERTARYNPMDIISTRGPQSVVAADDAKMLAEMCVIRTGEEKNPFFISSAQQLMTGLTLWQAFRHDDLKGGAAPEQLPERSLPAVRRLIMQPDLRDVLSVMSKHRNDTIAGIGSQFSSSPDKKTFSNILLTLQEQTFFLDSPVMAHALSATDLRFASLKEEATTAFLVLPSDRMETYKRYVRLLKTCAQTELIRSKASYEHKVVSLLDEFPRLGRFDQIEEGFSLHSGHGIQYIILTQSPAQMEKNYAEMARSFETNAQNRLYWAVNDKETAKSLSEEAGKMTVAVESASQNRSRSHSKNSSSSRGTSSSIKEQSRPLITQREVQDTSSEWCFVFNRDNRPTVLRRLNYLVDDYFDGLYDPHPAHDTAEEVAEAKKRREAMLRFLGTPTPQHKQASFDLEHPEEAQAEKQTEESVAAQAQKGPSRQETAGQEHSQPERSQPEPAGHSSRSEQRRISISP